MKTNSNKKLRIGRVISIIICAIILRFSLHPIEGGVFVLIPLSIAAWLFYLGRKNVFDYRINGEEYYDGWDNRQLESKGGFIEHCTEAAFVFVPLCVLNSFLFKGVGLYWLVPVVLIIMNIIGINDEDDDEDDDDGEWYKI